MKRRIIALLAASALLTATAGTAMAGPLPVPTDRDTGCTGLDVSFTAPAQGVANMTEETADTLWTTYLAVCD